MLKMIGDTTENLKERGLNWKEDQMELISVSFEEKIGDLKIEEGREEYVIKEVDSLRTMEALITKDADSMSAMRFRMNKANKAMWMDMKLLQEQRDGGRKKTQKVQGSGTSVHPSLMRKLELEWNKEMIDALHGWECRNLDLMGSRGWTNWGLSLEWFRVNQIRKARQRFIEGGRENIERLVLQRIWNCKEKVLDKERER